MDKKGLSPTCKLTLQEAEKKGISIEIMDPEMEFVQADINGHYTIFQTIPNQKGITLELFRHKHYTKLALRRMGFPVPDGAFCKTKSGALNYSNKIGFPLIIKAAYQQKGNKISSDIWSKAQMKHVLSKWKHGPIIVERFIVGRFYHILMLGDKIYCMEKVPAHVIGDARKTVKELITEKNQERHFPLQQIKITEEVKTCLAAQDSSIHDRPNYDKKIFLSQDHSLKKGADLRLIKPHTKTKELFLRLKQELGLNIISFNVVAGDLERTWEYQRFALLDFHKIPPLHLFASIDYTIPSKIWDLIETI